MCYCIILSEKEKYLQNAGFSVCMQSDIIKPREEDDEGNQSVEQGSVQYQIARLARKDAHGVHKGKGVRSPYRPVGGSYYKVDFLFCTNVI